MGAFSSDTPRLLWRCTIVACLLLIVNSYQVSADSKIDTDLVFDNLDQSNIKTHDNHPRIARDLSSEQIDTSPSEEQESWLIGSVKRLKRSISSLFNKNEHHYNKPVAHHKKISVHDNKKIQKNRSETRVLSKRKHRQVQGGQQEADEYEDEDDFVNGEDDYGNEYNNGDNNANGQQPGVKWSDDEDDLGVNSGEGSTGETLVPEGGHKEDSSAGEQVNFGHPKVYRFRITFVEPYVNDFNDRNSNAFRNLASRIKQAIEDLYAGIPGEQYATVVSVGKIESDAFKVIATIDVDSSNFYNKEEIRQTVFDQIDSNRRIGNIITLPENFYFSEFEEVNCDSNQLKCQTGECVPIYARCNGIRDCNDNSDEEGCPVEHATDPTLVETRGGSDIKEPYETEEPRILTPELTTTTTETPIEGSGDECRADDAVRCADGSKVICSDQKCDGIKDCDDGGDERNCPTDECALGEFKCDVNRCIPVSYLCNGQFDCSDRTDEHNCEPKCTTDEHQCDNKCISRDQVCDKRPDCEDGSDEADCPEPQSCRQGEFSCGDGSCIPDYLRCDRKPDCRNNNDELNCSRPQRCRDDEFTCGTGKCVPNASKCNRQYDCEDFSDEKNCPCLPTDFHCDNGHCIPRSQRCDGIHNCQDMSDERGCNKTCASHEWKCNDGTCIYQIYRCNEKIDCPDRSDEIGCPVCMPDQFRCSDKTCLSLSKICDGVSDCPLSEDEKSCVCSPEEFRCANGQCIDGRYRCNNISDCSDHSDEHDCNESSCADNQFRCNDDGTCIDIALRCDRVSDCFDNSDEIACGHACGPDEFDCGENCIDLKYRCDQYEDCKNGQDEIGCGTKCNRDEFECVPDGSCIPDSQKCDGRPDCSDNSDEYDCPPVGPTCRSNQLRCSDGSCIESYQQCDGIKDCPSGSDEEGCPCRTDEFQCTDGRCIDYNLRCNRRNDCSDGSDEYNCQPITTTFAPETTTQYNCREGYYPCASLTQCIRKEQICDGRADCYDLSDELNCVGSSEGLNLQTYPTSQEIKENREVVFQCRDEGPLRAKVVWRRPNGQPLPPGSVDRNGRLEIPNIKVQDSGTYLCVASGYPPQTPGAQVSVELIVSRWRNKYKRNH